MPLDKAMVSLTGDGLVASVECVSYAGAVWLVTMWNEAPREGWKTPKRTVRLDSLRWMPSNFAGCRYLVKDPLPKALFEDPAPFAEAGPFAVDEAPPQIRVEIPTGIH